MTEPIRLVRHCADGTTVERVTQLPLGVETITIIGHTYYRTTQHRDGAAVFMTAPAK